MSSCQATPPQSADSHPGTSGAGSPISKSSEATTVRDGSNLQEEGGRGTPDLAGLLDTRKKLLQQYLDQLPRNREDKEQLLSSGYSSLLWEKV